MRWDGQSIRGDRDDALPGMTQLSGLVRTVRTPEFAGITFHEVLAKTALNRVPEASRMLAGEWTVNPYRGCTHACRYCFARSTHRYLDLNTGEDFDNQIVVKTNVVQLLTKELLSKRPPRVALGTNTDPYQRAEGKYRFMPGIIEALGERAVPFSILTKGTLLRRDLDQLGEVAAVTDVSLAMSIGVFDEELQHSVEPGTATTAARLQTVQEIRQRGLTCTVLLAPILPYLTDDDAQLDHALAELKAAGATQVFYTALYLRDGVKEWFMSWLARAYPERLADYESLYGGGAYTPRGYQDDLRVRMRALLARHGFSRGGTEGFARSRARSSPADTRPEPARQPALF
jgi:DNA repair photolyase